MTLHRQRAHALLVALTLLVSVGVAHAAPPDAPKPAPSARAWLRGGAPPKTKAAPAASSNPLRMTLMGALILILGGAALVVKRRKKVRIKANVSELSLLTAARVGPKAQVVVVSVGGRKLLLGVTDAHVSSLGWLEGELEGLPEAANLGEPLIAEQFGVAALEPSAAEVVPRGLVRAEPVAAPKRFRDVLLNALGKSEPRVVVDAAVTIAETTHDVVTRSRYDRPAVATAPSRVAAPAGAPEMVNVEGQARGLVLRLQKRG